MTVLKKFLLGLMLFGAVTYFGGGGTFASFSAETSNNGSSVSSGTLTMSNTVNGGGGCLTVTTSYNVNPACPAAMSLTNVAPGAFGGVGKIAIQNTGSIDASKLSFWASSVNAILNGALTAGVAVTSLPVSGLEGTVAAGDTITVTSGALTDTFVAGGAGASASNAATSIPVVSHAPVSSYSVGATVTDTSSNANANNTDCYDTKTTVSGSAGSTKGTDLSFNPIAGNPFCTSVLIYVQEITSGRNYCWLGNGAGSVNGMCTAPVSVNLSGAGLSTGSPITSLPVTALNGNVKSSDQIVVSSGSHTQTFTVSASSDAYYGATSITVNSATPNFAYPPSSTVIDSTTLGTLNSDTTDTLRNFDTVHGSGGRIFVSPLLANGSADTNSPVQLGRSGSSTDTRTFVVGLYMPSPTGLNQNPLQGLSSTFGITWHLDQ
jgi:hypothetical protein